MTSQKHLVESAGVGARAKTEHHQLDVDVLEAAHQRVRYAYELYDHVCVSFSGGKDSTATLHVTLDVAAELDRLPLRVVFFDEEAIPWQTVDYVKRVAARPDVELEWYCLPVRHRNACSNEDDGAWWPWAPEAEDRWVRPMPTPDELPAGTRLVTQLDGFDTEPPSSRWSIPDLHGLLFDPTVHGRPVDLLGIRAAESIVRHAAVTNRARENWLIPDRAPTRRGPLDKGYPIYDWTDADVWTAPALHGWDYNRAYDLLELAGLSPRDQRCAPPFGEEPMRGLWTFSVCFPELWDRMVDRVPGAATAYRYARTELYAYRGLPPKPDELTWQEYVEHLIRTEHAPDVQGQVAFRVRRHMRTHYRRTSDPILPTARHPETGVCWQSLAILAQRGDLKARRAPLSGTDPVMIAKRQAEYDAQRAQLEERLGRPLTADDSRSLR